MDIGKLAGQAKDLVEEHGDKIEDGLDKVAEIAKDRTDYDDKIDMAVDKAKAMINQQQGINKQQG